jgi:hypothetical protein
LAAAWTVSAQSGHVFRESRLDQETYPVRVVALSVVISLSALAVSVWALLASRAKDRRDLFLEIHRLLIDPDLLHGRRLLSEKISCSDDATALREADPEGYQKVNRRSRCSISSAVMSCADTSIGN